MRIKGRVGVEGGMALLKSWIYGPTGSEGWTMRIEIIMIIEMFMTMPVAKHGVGVILVRLHVI
jgi:hypothetical protein